MSKTNWILKWNGIKLKLYFRNDNCFHSDGLINLVKNRTSKKFEMFLNHWRGNDVFSSQNIFPVLRKYGYIFMTSNIF